MSGCVNCATINNVSRLLIVFGTVDVVVFTAGVAPVDFITPITVDPLLVATLSTISIVPNAVDTLKPAVVDFVMFAVAAIVVCKSTSTKKSPTLATAASVETNADKFESICCMRKLVPKSAYALVTAAVVSVMVLASAVVANALLRLVAPCCIIPTVLVCANVVARFALVCLICADKVLIAKSLFRFALVCLILAACRLRLIRFARVTSLERVLSALELKFVSKAKSIEPLRLAIAKIVGLNTPLKLAPVFFITPTVDDTATATLKFAVASSIAPSS